MTPGDITRVELRNVTKRFGGVLANDGVNLQVSRGSIHGVIGENGAGKSTAMNILYGLHRPDSGGIFINGQPRSWRSPSEAIAAGIGMVHQHFMLAGPHTALDNIILGAESSRWGLLDRTKARTRLEALVAQYGFRIDLDRPVEEFPVGLQQRIEILKLLYRGAQILILDEPTAVLTPQEVVELFRHLKNLRDEGKAILLITHKLREVLAFADRVSVMRAGKVTGESSPAQTTAQKLADLMVGRRVNLKLDVKASAPAGQWALEVANLSARNQRVYMGSCRGNEADLEVDNLSARNRRRDTLRNVSLAVRCGEIVGLAGVEGNGQSELIQALLHPGDPKCRASGAIKVLGHTISEWPAKRIRELGVALIPEDRHHEGLLLNSSLLENFALGLQTIPAFCRAGFIRWLKLGNAADRSLAAFDVRPRDLAANARQLSGGNQQKLVVAREFFRNPKLLIAAQPTRGVDVGAIEFIHAQIVQARNKGAGVLLVSSELEEILALSDRILVMFEGAIVGEFSRETVTESELGLRMAGIQRGA